MRLGIGRLGKPKGTVAAVRPRDGIFGIASPEEAGISKSKHQSPVLAIVFQNNPLATLFEVQKIVEAAGLIVIMLELNSAHRQTYMDGSKLPAYPEPL